MRGKIIRLSIGVLIVSVITLIAFSDKPQQEDFIVYSDSELAWLEDQAINGVGYYLDSSDNDLIDGILQTISIIGKVDMVEVKDSNDLSKTLIISNDPNGYKLTHHKSRPLLGDNIHYYRAIVQAEKSDGPIGILYEDEQWISLLTEPLNTSFRSYQTIEEMMVAEVNGTLNGFILMGKPKLIMDVELGLFHSIDTLAYGINPIYLFTPDADETFTEVISKTLDYMLANGSVDRIVENAYNQLQNDVFWQLLNEDERTLLKAKEKLTVGLEMDAPWVIHKDGKLYGVIIGYLNYFSQISGLRIDYVIGERDKLLEAINDGQLDALWLNQPTDELIAGNQLFESDYVIVGIGGSPEIKRVSDIAVMRVGSYFKARVNGPLRAIVAQENMKFYNSNDHLVEALKANRTDVIVMTRVDFEYYESIHKMSELDIRYTLDHTYTTHLFFRNDQSNQLNLFNKAYWVYDANKGITTSLNDIPVDEESKTIYWQLVGWISIGSFLIVMFLVGLSVLNRREKRQMNYLFTHDQITYLPNKFGLKSHIESSVAHGDHGVILLIDIDNMKSINDRLGHIYGDQVIIEFAQKLMSIVDDNMVLGRTGGDEFVFAFKNGDLINLEEVVRNIRVLATEYGQHKDELYDFTVSIASITYPEADEVFESLYRYLEYSLDYAKDSQGLSAYMKFSPEIYNNYLLEQTLVKEIRMGLTNSEFVLFIQPQIKLPNKTISGGEVLIRWQHPTKGLIPPGLFLDVAEKNGLMREIDYYVFEKVAPIIKAWQERYTYYKISINMSTETFEDHLMLKNLETYRHKHGVDLSWVTIEVTEDMGFENMENANIIFNKLRRLGFSVALDDFGKGYSSLSYLEKMTIDTLKIDKAFIDNIHTKTKSMEIFRAIVKLAEIMKIDIVAEGVEYIEQVKLLEEFDQIVAQGYYFSKPFPIEHFDDFIETFQA